MLSVESILSKNFKTIGPETVGRPPLPPYLKVWKKCFILLYISNIPHILHTANCKPLIWLLENFGQCQLIFIFIY